MLRHHIWWWPSYCSSRWLVQDIPWQDAGNIHLCPGLSPSLFLCLFIKPPGFNQGDPPMSIYNTNHLPVPISQHYIWVKLPHMNPWGILDPYPNHNREGTINGYTPPAHTMWHFPVFWGKHPVLTLTLLDFCLTEVVPRAHHWSNQGVNHSPKLPPSHWLPSSFCGHFQESGGAILLSIIICCVWSWYNCRKQSWGYRWCNQMW